MICQGVNNVNYFCNSTDEALFDYKKLRDLVDLFNLFQSLAFEEMEPIITGCQSYWQVQDNKHKI